uniref:Uncharacterized protein n=1 Tax=Arundo donax TaxID=35708 RepID=A0A0A9EL31_ARUDO
MTHLKRQELKIMRQTTGNAMSDIPVYIQTTTTTTKPLVPSKLG